jgi:cytochrome P450
MCARRADTSLVSGRGVAANEAVNGTVTPITLTSDGDVHNRRRQALIQPVMPGPLKGLRARLAAEAERLVDELATTEPFEAMSRFASASTG